MSTSKHTPGPWVIKYTDAVYAQSGRFIADCELTPYDARPQPPNSTDAANAHLIAAAPAMYEALKTIQWLAEEGLSSLEQAANDGGKDAHAEYDRAWNALDQLQAALAHAEGRG